MKFKIIDFLRVFVKVICSISIVGVYQSLVHWFILSNIQTITDYLSSFGKPRIIVIGLLMIVITHYVFSFNLLFKDWLPFWEPEERKKEEIK